MILNIQVIAAVLTTLLGLVYGLAAYSLPLAAIGNPLAPKLYPLMLGGIMTVLGIVLLVSEAKKQRAGTAEEPVRFRLEFEGRIVAFVSVACVVYAMLFETLGYMISTFLFLEALMIYNSKGKKMLAPTLWALGFSVGVYFLFSKLLSIQLPPIPFLDL